VIDAPEDHLPAEVDEHVVSLAPAEGAPRLHVKGRGFVLDDLAGLQRRGFHPCEDPGPPGVTLHVGAQPHRINRVQGSAHIHSRRSQLVQGSGEGLNGRLHGFHRNVVVLRVLGLPCAEPGHVAIEGLAVFPLPEQSGRVVHDFLEGHPFEAAFLDGGDYVLRPLVRMRVQLLDLGDQLHGPLQVVVFDGFEQLLELGVDLVPRRPDPRHEPFRGVEEVRIVFDQIAQHQDSLIVPLFGNELLHLGQLCPVLPLDAAASGGIWDRGYPQA
jgi:hypothetical protein